MLRHTFLCILVLCCASLVGCKKKTPPADATVEARESPIRPLVAEKLAPSSFAVVGEVIGPDRRAIVVWPGLVEGDPSPVVTFVFAREGNTWTPVGERLDLPARDGDRVLSEAVGGRIEGVVRDCGVPPDELADHLKQHGRSFAAALESVDSDAAVAAFEQMARAFDWQHVGPSSMLLQLLLTDAPKSWYCGPKGCTVESEFEGRRRMQTFAHDDCGQGKVVGRALAAEP